MKVLVLFIYWKMTVNLWQTKNMISEKVLNGTLQLTGFNSLQVVCIH